MRAPLSETNRHLRDPDALLRNVASSTAIETGEAVDEIDRRLRTGLIDPNGFNELKMCRSGPMLYNKNDWPIGESLKRYGEFSWGEIEIFRLMVKPDWLVVDAGANIGTHTVEFSMLAGCVLAFEPQRIAFQTLCANVALNNCLNVHAFHAALGREDGLIKVPVRDQRQRNNFGGVQLAGVTEGETVDLMRLDRLTLSRCDFIKADVEGMEADFLAGAENTIAKHRPFLYLEADGAQAEEAKRMLHAWSYEYYASFVKLFNPENFAGNEENVFFVEGAGEIHSINMLCVPMERRQEVNGLPATEATAKEEVVLV